MKVQDTGRISSIQQYNKTKYIGNEKSGERKMKDAVEISVQAKELHEMRYTTSADKLESLKEAVRTGTYHVDAKKIAETLYPYVKPNSME